MKTSGSQSNRGSLIVKKTADVVSSAATLLKRLAVLIAAAEHLKIILKTFLDH